MIEQTAKRKTRAPLPPGSRLLGALGEDDVRGLARTDVLGAGIAELHQVEAGEEMFTSAEEHRRDCEVELIDEAELEILPDRRDPAAEADIFAAGGFDRALERD